MEWKGKEGVKAGGGERERQREKMGEARGDERNKEEEWK